MSEQSMRLKMILESVMTGSGLSQTGSAVEKLKSSIFSLKGALVGLVGGFSLAQVIQNTERQEAAQKQLETAVRSTGGAAGYSAKELADMAAGLQKVTNYGDEATMEMQAVLLTFTKIGRETFPQATEAVLDMAQRLGGDLKSASLQVGKALNDPIQGVGALARAGVQFTEQQEKQIRTLVESGRTVDAQRIILAELETQFGGSARAARDTFGGALKSLKNAFGDLLEGKSGLPEAQQRIEKLTAVLSDPQTAAAADHLISVLIGGLSSLVESAGHLGNAIALLKAYQDDKISFWDFMTAGPDDAERLLKEAAKVDAALEGLKTRVAELKAAKQGNFYWSDAEEADLQKAAAALDAYQAKVAAVAAGAQMAPDGWLSRDQGSAASRSRVAADRLAQQARAEASAKIEKAITLLQADEMGRRLLAVDDWVTAQSSLLDKATIDEAGRQKKQTEILRAAEAERTKIIAAAAKTKEDRLKAEGLAAARNTPEDGWLNRDQGAKTNASVNSAALAQRLAELRQALSGENALIEQEYQKRMATIRELRRAGATDQAELDALEVAAEKQKQADLTKVAEQGEQQRRQQTMTTAMQIAGSAAQLAGTLAGIQDQSSRKGFKQYQGFAKAQAEIQSALAILSVWSDATIPSMYAKIAASIAVGATTAVQVARIDSMQYQGAKGTGGQGSRGDRLMVGERGPEEIVLGDDATVIPNDRMGGGGVRQINSVTNVFQISPGLSGAIQAEIMRALPMIGQYTTSSVLAAVNSGGDLSRAVGRMR